MSTARVEKVHADRLGARMYLEQAEKFQSDADSDLSTESRSVLLHNAAEASVEEAREDTAELVEAARDFLRD
jgi:hypothetical protein